MLQKQLKQAHLSTAGATFARFIYSAPLVALIVWAYAGYSGQAVPSIPHDFWGYAIFGALAQILATVCVVALFGHRNFAVGITFKKTEVLLSALVGLIVLGEGVTWLGFAAICIGLIGVLLLSDPPAATGPLRTRVLNRATALGLTSGLFFAISGVGYRGASLSLPSGDTFMRAVFTLAVVSAMQVVMMLLWMGWRERAEIGKVLRAWRKAGLVGLTSMLGSICWFTAFTLQTVAYVNAVGQSELLVSLAIGALVFREKISTREWQGIGLLAASVVLLVLFN